MDYDQVLMLILAQKKSKSIQRIKYSQKYSNIFKSLYQVHINGLVVELWVITSNVSCSDSPGAAYCSLSRRKKINEVFIKLTAQTNTLISLLIKNPVKFC